MAIMTFAGEPIKINDKEVNLSELSIAILTGDTKEDIDARCKIQRYNLAKQIHTTGANPAQLMPNEKEIIVKRAGVFFPTLVVGALVEALGYDI